MSVKHFKRQIECPQRDTFNLSRTMSQLPHRLNFASIDRDDITQIICIIREFISLDYDNMLPKFAKVWYIGICTAISRYLHQRPNDLSSSKYSQDIQNNTFT